MPAELSDLARSGSVAPNTWPSPFTLGNLCVLTAPCIYQFQYYTSLRISNPSNFDLLRLCTRHFHLSCYSLSLVGVTGTVYMWFILSSSQTSISKAFCVGKKEQEDAVYSQGKWFTFYSHFLWTQSQSSSWWQVTVGLWSHCILRRRNCRRKHHSCQVWLSSQQTVLSTGYTERQPRVDIVRQD